MPKMQIANSFFLEFELDLTQPHITGLSGEGCPNFTTPHRPLSLGNVGLNPPLHTQHIEGVRGCN
jgi:hypothetical protein